MLYIKSRHIQIHHMVEVRGLEPLSIQSPTI